MFVSAHYLAPDLLLEIVILLLPQRHCQRNHLIKRPVHDVGAGLVLEVGIAAVRAGQVSRRIDRDLPIELLEKLTLAVTVILVLIGVGDDLRTPQKFRTGWQWVWVILCPCTCGGHSHPEAREHALAVDSRS